MNRLFWFLLGCMTASITITLMNNDDPRRP